MINNQVELKHKDVTDKILHAFYKIVYFQNQVVGEYFADLIVNEVVVIELKAVSRLLDEHEAQLLNYLRATPYEVGLLLNFGPKPDFKRKVFENSRKTTTWEQK